MTRHALLRTTVLFALALALALGVAVAQPQDSPMLRKIRDTGLVTLGHRADSAPFSYLDAKRRPIGYSVDICRHIVDAIRARLGKPDIEVRVVIVTSSTRLSLLANRAIDLECGATTNTAERQKSVAFSVTTFVAASRLLAKKASGIHTLNDLRGQPVATTVSTTSMDFLTEVNRARDLGMRILAGADDREAFQMVRTDHAIAFAMDDVLLRSVLSKATDADDFAISELALTIEPYAIGVAPKDAVFKQLVDDAIIDLYRSGRIQALYSKWFESPIPLTNVNLKWPMSAPLRRVFATPTDSPDPSLYR